MQGGKDLWIGRYYVIEEKFCYVQCDNVVEECYIFVLGLVFFFVQQRMQCCYQFVDQYKCQ